jgi:hypothetical protein
VDERSACRPRFGVSGRATAPTHPGPRYAAPTHTQRGGVAAWTTVSVSVSVAVWLVVALVSSIPSPVPASVPFAHQVGAPGQDKGPQSRPVSESSGGTILLGCLVSAANVNSSRSDRPSSDTLIILPLHRQSTPQNGIHSPRLAVGDSRLATLHVICRVASVARANDTAKGPARSVCWSLALGQT